jgi:exopolysaccharide production protein ExoZ
VKLWSLQIVRFFAALAVVHLHSVASTLKAGLGPGLFGHAATMFGRAGVDVFFVLSGVIIATTARGLGAGEFVGKRVRRIFPIYLLLTAPWLLLHFAAGDVTWRGLLATVTLWPATDRLTAPLMPVAWTLCFEALFYACAALVLWRPRALWVVLAAYVAALCVRQGPLLQFLGNPIILEFLFGVGLAYAPRWKPAVWAIPFALGVLVVGAVLNWPPHGDDLTSLRGDGAWIRVLVLGVPSAMIVWGALQIDGKPGVLSYLGDASYSLYLIHPLVLIGLAAALEASPYSYPVDLIIVVGIALSILAAWRIHELFEKPILEFLKRPLPAKPATA